MDNKAPSQELLAGTLAVTREQLSRSMNLCAELEALLGIEKRKNAELNRQLSEYTAGKQKTTASK
jgi:hypothetical protein